LAEIDDFILRRNDFSDDEAHESLRESFRAFLDKSCPSERVRSAEPVGWDEALWRQLRDLRPIVMSVPEDVGGDGAGLIELALVAQEIGRRAAPVPFVETATAARVLAGLKNRRAGSALADIMDGAVASIAVAAPPGESRRLVSAGACARYVVALSGDDLVLASTDDPPQAVANLAGAPLAWWDLDDAEVLASGTDAVVAMDRAEQELRVLTAASLVGLGASALESGVQYAKDREAFGVPIGSFQAVAHPLADVAIGMEAARRIVMKAAWFGDHEPSQLAKFASMAFIQASGASLLAGQVAIHVQGGFGFTLESDAQLYYRRAKGWSLVVGSVADECQRLADQLYPRCNQPRGVA
jgi:alkylation response protein AidB-like acyl-CoA dehydrogenase